jgi:hypothetical protein
LIRAAVARAVGAAGDRLWEWVVVRRQWRSERTGHIAGATTGERLTLTGPIGATDTFARAGICCATGAFDVASFADKAIFASAGSITNLAGETLATVDAETRFRTIRTIHRLTVRRCRTGLTLGAFLFARHAAPPAIALADTVNAGALVATREGANARTPLIAKLSAVQRRASVANAAAPVSCAV